MVLRHCSCVHVAGRKKKGCVRVKKERKNIYIYKGGMCIGWKEGLGKLKYIYNESS